MCAAVFGVRVALVDAGTPATLRLLACAAVGAVVYAAMCAWRVPELKREARGLLHRLRKRSAPVVPAAAAVES
jgi:uncharacterized integral membrane protein